MVLVAVGLTLLMASLGYARWERDRRGERLRRRRAQMVELHLRRVEEWHRRRAEEKKDVSK